MINELKIGEKIKKRRLELGLTQKELCRDKITRNMLSLIESGAATPSLETAAYLAANLNLPISYLFSNDDSLFSYEKSEKIQQIKELYRKKNYKHCLSIIDSMSDSDDELNYIRARCCFLYGKELLFGGSLQSATAAFNNAVLYADGTVYETEDIKAMVPMYLAVCTNIQSPLLELDSQKYEQMCADACDFEFYKYITMDYNFDFSNIAYKRHLEAKSLMKKYSYTEAISILMDLEQGKNSYFNACVLFGVYTDLETAFKQIGDFENAYRYSSKRISLINGFKI